MDQEWVFVLIQKIPDIPKAHQNCQPTKRLWRTNPAVAKAININTYTFLKFKNTFLERVFLTWVKIYILYKDGLYAT